MFPPQNAFQSHRDAQSVGIWPSGNGVTEVNKHIFVDKAVLATLTRETDTVAGNGWALAILGAGTQGQTAVADCVVFF